jgi:hypothetical protein
MSRRRDKLLKLAQLYQGQFRRLHDTLVNQRVRYNESLKISKQPSHRETPDEERRSMDLKRKRRERLLLHYHHMKFARAQHASLRADIIKLHSESEEVCQTATAIEIMHCQSAEH